MTLVRSNLLFWRQETFPVEIPSTTAKTRLHSHFHLSARRNTRSLFWELALTLTASPMLNSADFTCDLLTFFRSPSEAEALVWDIAASSMTWSKEAGVSHQGLEVRLFLLRCMVVDMKWNFDFKWPLIPAQNWILPEKVQCKCTVTISVQSL